jgi:hypothetical protein
MRLPSAKAKLTKASKENLEMRPRSKSLMRGRVTAQWLAASNGVQPVALYPRCVNPRVLQNG